MKNIWTIVLFILGLGLVILGIIEPYVELVGLNSQWVGLAVLLLGGIKQYIEQKGLLTPDESDNITAKFANELLEKPDKVVDDINSEITVKDIDNSKVTVEGVRGSKVTVQDVKNWRSKK